MPGQGVLNSTLKARKIATHSSYSLYELQMVPKGPCAISQPLTWSNTLGSSFLEGLIIPTLSVLFCKLGVLKARP